MKSEKWNTISSSILRVLRVLRAKYYWGHSSCKSFLLNNQKIL